MIKVKPALFERIKAKWLDVLCWIFIGKKCACCGKRHRNTGMGFNLPKNGACDDMWIKFIPFHLRKYAENRLGKGPAYFCMDCVRRTK